MREPPDRLDLVARHLDRHAVESRVVAPVHGGVRRRAAELLLEILLLPGEVREIRAACGRVDIDVALGCPCLPDALQPRERVPVLGQRWVVELDDDADNVRFTGCAAGRPGGNDAERDQERNEKRCGKRNSPCRSVEAF